MKLTHFTLVAVGAAAIAAPVFAHHSGAMFDRNKEVTLVGTLKEIQWTNPHGWIEVMASGPEGGAPVQWSVEAAGPAGFARMGLKKDPPYPAPGDKITILAHPMRDGRHGGSYISMTLADGKTFEAQTPGQAGSAGGGPAR